MAEKMKKTGIMDGAGEEDYKNDPEAEDNAKKYRLPFALCKQKGLAIQDWWTPRDAWEALKNGGYVKNVSEEYDDYYDNLKKERLQEKSESNKRAKERAKKKKAQLKNLEHNPDKNYVHQDGKIAGAARGKPMTHKQADNGNVNPYYEKGYIGYRTNCQTCVATYIARRQGYNVRALPNLNNRNIDALSLDTSLAYVDKYGRHPEQVQKPKGENAIGFLDRTIQTGEIFGMSFKWKNLSNGHIVTCGKNKDGELFIYDPQTNEQHSNISKYMKRMETSTLKVMNLTNVRIDEKFCDTIMKGERSGERGNK